MPLLPRTVRGTWLLAGAVWVAWCGAFWFGLPVRPRAEWRLPEESYLVGVRPDKCTLVTARIGWTGTICTQFPMPHGPVRLRDLATGHERSLLSPTTTKLDCVCLSPSGRWLAVAEFPRLRLFDLDSGHTLDVGPKESWFTVEAVFFGPEDRWLMYVMDVYDETQPSLSARVVSLVVSLPDGTERDAGLKDWRPLALSADGRVLAAQVCLEAKGEPTADALEKPSELRVVDLETRQTLLTVPCRQFDPRRLLLSSDGRIFAAFLSDRGDIRSSRVRCWDTATGRELLNIPDTADVVLTPDGRTLVTLAYPDDRRQATYWDVAAGAVRGQARLPLHSYGGLLDYDLLSSLLAPTGRTVVVPAHVNVAAPMARLAWRLGLRWPFATARVQGCAPVLDTATGRQIGEVPAVIEGSAWSPDGTQLVTLSPGRQEVQVWDIPPRKPLTWFLAMAASLALPLAWLARRRVGRLRRATA
jgi:WD40 repeat protein